MCIPIVPDFHQCDNSVRSWKHNKAYQKDHLLKTKYVFKLGYMLIIGLWSDSVIYFFLKIL